MAQASDARPRELSPVGQQEQKVHDAHSAVEVEDYEDVQQLLEALIELYDAWGKPAKTAEYRALLPEAEEVRDSD